MKNGRIFSCGNWDPGLCNPQSSRNPESHNDWNPGTLDERRSHPESKTVLDFLTRFRGELKFRLAKYAANNNLSKIKTNFSLPLTDFYFTV